MNKFKKYKNKIIKTTITNSTLKLENDKIKDENNEAKIAKKKELKDISLEQKIEKKRRK